MLCVFIAAALRVLHAAIMLLNLHNNREPYCQVQTQWLRTTTTGLRRLQRTPKGPLLIGGHLLKDVVQCVWQNTTPW